MYEIGILRKGCSINDPQLNWAKSVIVSGADLKIRDIKKYEDIINVNPFNFENNKTVCIFLIDTESQSQKFVYAGLINSFFKSIPNSLADNFEHSNNHAMVQHEQNNSNDSTLEYLKQIAYKLEQELEEQRERNRELNEELLAKRSELAQLLMRQAIREEIEEKLAKEISSQNKSTGLDGILESATALAPIANLLMGFLGKSDNTQKQLPSMNRTSTIPKPVFNNIEEE